jgi:hypothetical protein
MNQSSIPFDDTLNQNDQHDMALIADQADGVNFIPAVDNVLLE